MDQQMKPWYIFFLSTMVKLHINVLDDLDESMPNHDVWIQLNNPVEQIENHHPISKFHKKFFFKQKIFCFLPHNLFQLHSMQG